MNPLIYNLTNLIAVCLIASGVYMLLDTGAALIVSGGLLIGMNYINVFIMLKQKSRSN